jgi:flagellar motility protein MotE (MotC chaperone)
MVYDALRNVPVIGNLIPAADESEPQPPRMSYDELRAHADTLERNNDSITRERNNLLQQVENLQNEVGRLRGFEEQQEQFKQDLSDFHAAVYEAFPVDYAKWFQQFDPDMAAEYAREAAGTAQINREVRDHVNTIRAMEPRNSAAMLELLMDTNSDIVVSIMLNLTSDERAEILDNMSLDKRTSLFRLLTPFGLQ